MPVPDPTSLPPTSFPPTLLLGDDPAALQREVLQQCLTALQEERARGTAGTVLWLVPTQQARKQWTRTLVSSLGFTLMASPVVTFNSFAERLLQAAGRPATAISPTVRRLLLRRITQQMAQDRRLSHFAPVVTTTGFLDIVEAFIAELKRDEIWPEEFLAACRDGAGLSVRDQELGEIYLHYQQILNVENWYDSEGRFWLARTELEKGRCRGLPAWSWIGVAGFTDFTLTEMEILEQLWPRTKSLVLTLPHDPGGREAVFARSTMAARALGKLFPNLRQRTVSALPGESLDRRHLRQGLFGNPREVTPATTCQHLQVVGCTGSDSEVTSVALQIKTWLRAGVKPGHIAIGLRSITEDGLRWRDTLQATGLPVWCDTGAPFAACGLIKFLLAVLQAELDDWQFARITGVFGSSYLSPPREVVQGDAELRSVARVLRGLRLPQGRVQILDSATAAARRLAAAAVEADADREVDADRVDDPDDVIYRGLSAADCVPAARALQWYQQVTQRLRRPQSLANWADVLTELLHELGALPGAAQPDHPDQLLWELWQRSMRDAAAAEEQYLKRPREFPLAEFVDELRDLLNGERQDPLPEPAGSVRILGLDELRHLETPYLVVAGLTEESFPRRRSDDCLFSDAERRQLADQGLPIRHASLHQQEEMLFFYQVMLSAGEQLLLTYPEVNHRGQPAFASPYVTALRTLWTDAALPIRHEGQLDPVPDPARAVHAGDARLIATRAALDGDFGWLRTLWESPATQTAVTGVVAAVEMARHRFHTAGFTPYEGQLEIAAHQEWLSRKFHETRQFSATELESYATCPFRFWLQSILKVEPLPEVEQGTDVQRRGVVVHDVLSRLIDDMQPDPEVDRLVLRFQQLAGELLDQQIAESDLQRALLRIEQQVLSEWGQAYGEQFGIYAEKVGLAWGGRWSLAAPELPFGDVPGSRQNEAASRATPRVPPLELGPPGQQVRIRGRIDRIDTGVVEGQKVYTVIDYKTGSRRALKKDDLDRGLSLQLILYAMAARRLGMVSPEAVPYQIGYWCLRETGFQTGFSTRKKDSLPPIEAADWLEYEQVIEETIPRLARGIRSGEFVVHNHDENCTSRCAFRTVCRVQQIRPLADTLHKVRSGTPLAAVAETSGGEPS